MKSCSSSSSENFSQFSHRRKSFSERIYLNCRFYHFVISIQKVLARNANLPRTRYVTHWWKNGRCTPPLCSCLSLSLSLSLGTTERKRKTRPAQKEQLVFHRCNLKCAFSSSGKLAGYQATVASLSSILIRALNNRIRTNLSLPIWYRCVSSWADDAWQAVTIVSDIDSRQYRPSDGHFSRFTVAQSSHGSRHFGHRLQLDQFPIVPLADFSAVRDH